MVGDLENIIKGIVHFHCETGTEGGYWAFQDNEYITPNTTKYSCTKCHLYWDMNQNKSIPIHEGDYCAPEKHEFKLFCKNDWSYEGLQILENGDELTIYHPETKDVVWTGTIALTQYNRFTEHTRGLRIHADQQGVDRETWAEYFLKEYPAELTKKK